MASSSFDALFKSIRKGEVPSAIYLHGPEELLKEELIAAIAAHVLDPATRDFNFDVRSATTLDPSEVEALCNTLPMMSARRLVVIREVEAWSKRAKAKSGVVAYLERPSPETVLVLVQGGDAGPDPELVSRTVAAAAEPLSPERAKKWLVMHAGRLGLELEDRAAEHLVRVADASLGELRTELSKLAGLAGCTPITLERVAALVGVRHGETQYDWRDSVLADDPGRAASLLEHVLGQSGVTGVSLVMLLGTSLAGIGLARSHYDRGVRGGALVQAIKTSLFRARPARLSFDAAALEWSRLAPRWPAPRIERALAAAQRADERLKNTAVSGERAILFDFVMELALPWQSAA